MLVISGEKCRACAILPRYVSISQSRCLSFQVYLSATALDSHVSFNLAIEMLVISGRKVPFIGFVDMMFQSRNRDACHFRFLMRTDRLVYQSFNLAIEMLVISGCVSPPDIARVGIGFNLAIEMLVISG